MGSQIINKETEKEIYMAALTKWGPVAQTIMVFEEMAELQKELSKCLRGEEVTGNIAEEIADVEIMINKMKELFNIEEEVEAQKQFKLNRLKDNTKDTKVRICRKCGCTEYRACEGSCYWVEEDLCSSCISKK